MLSPLIIVTPMMGWTWPVLLPIAVAAASAYGFRQLTGNDASAWLRGELTRRMENLRRVSVPIDEIIADVVGEEVGRDERIVFERDNLRLIFGRDPRGKFFVDVLGPIEAPTKYLREQGQLFAHDLVQSFVYNRVAKELEARGLNITQETVDEDSGDILLEMRRWR